MLSSPTELLHGDAAMKRTLVMKTLRTFHVWTGLTIGALFCVMSLSGSVLVLSPLIEGWLRPAWTPKSDARPSYVLTEASTNIAQQWPNARIGTVSFPAHPGSPIEVGVRIPDGDQLRIYVDARSGEVLGTFALPWLDWLTDLHHHLQVESVGKRIVGSIGICLILSSLTGLLTWAVRSSRWTRMFGKRRGTAWQFTKFDLHRSVGVIGNALLLFVSTTGVVISFPQTVSRLLGAPAEVARPPYPRIEGRPENPLVQATLEKYLAAAERAVPGGTVRQLRIPPTPDRPVIARLWLPGDLQQTGSTRVSFEPGTARVLVVDKPAEWPLPKRIVRAATPLHYGEWGGISLRVLWFFIGLMPAVLYVSGVMMWWGPFQARRKAARAAAARTLVREEDLVI
jgi:uncharacterized iron-regulated membrane protein